MATTLSLIIAEPVTLTLTVADAIGVVASAAVTAPEQDPIFGAWRDNNKATAAEINTGTTAAKYITPLGLSGSYYQRIVVSDTAPADTTLLWFDTSI
jgi:hypothetical protein